MGKGCREEEKKEAFQGSTLSLIHESRASLTKSPHRSVQSLNVVTVPITFQWVLEDTDIQRITTLNTKHQTFS